MPQNDQIMVKFLVVRFSSIGDIVLTTPVVRGLKKQVEGAVVHYLTKPQFAGIVENNPNVDKVHVLADDLNETVKELMAENFDYLIDLHHNLRTSLLKRKLPIVNFSFNKLNLRKWLYVNLKINTLPDVHIVDRYRDTVNVFDVNDDGKGLDFYIPERDKVDPIEKHSAFKGKYMVVVLGANHATKQIPKDKIVNIINYVGMPVCLVGGKDVETTSSEIEQQLKVPFLNTVGKINLNQSASFIEQCHLVLTPDTGMMHIAAAFKKDIISLWGNTVPEFGMYPYRAGENSKPFEIKKLRCRPCSKIGFKKCPKGHFNCMNNIDNNIIINYINTII